MICALKSDKRNFAPKQLREGSFTLPFSAFIYFFVVTVFAFDQLE